jgi:hypothetical protein
MEMVKALAAQQHATEAGTGGSGSLEVDAPFVPMQLC